MERFSVLFFLALYSLSAEALSSDEQCECLKAHNMMRARHGTSSMTWDSSLAKGAQRWADYLIGQPKLKHASLNDIGENLYSARYSGYQDGQCAQAVRNWYMEIEDYNWQTTYSKNGKDTGHFTQVVWKASTRLGVGIASKKMTNGLTRVVVVARYKPQGNMNSMRSGESYNAGHVRNWNANVKPVKRNAGAIPSVAQMRVGGNCGGSSGGSTGGGSSGGSAGGGGGRGGGSSGYTLVANARECSGSERKIGYLKTAGECAAKCAEVSTMFIFGTNDYGKDRCKKKYWLVGPKICACFCETSSMLGWCNTVTHRGYKLYRYNRYNTQGYGDAPWRSYDEANRREYDEPRPYRDDPRRHYDEARRRFDAPHARSPYDIQDYQAVADPVVVKAADPAPAAPAAAPVAADPVVVKAVAADPAPAAPVAPAAPEASAEADTVPAGLEKMEELATADVVEESVGDAKETEEIAQDPMQDRLYQADHDSLQNEREAENYRREMIARRRDYIRRVMAQRAADEQE